MGDNKDKKAESDRLSTIIGARQAAFPSFFTPMLASPGDKAFTREGWIYEPKLDGMRALALVNSSKTDPNASSSPSVLDKVELFSRSGRSITAQYPGLAHILGEQCRGPVVLDGEIIALNAQGRPSFQLLQQRIGLQKLTDIKRAEERVPVHYFIFDILYADGYSLSRCPLRERKKVLMRYVDPDKRIIILKSFDFDGVIAYQASIDNGFEGIVAKRMDSPYEPGRRSPSWVKVKAVRSAEFLIGGYSIGQGSRNSTFGSLVLGYYDDQNRLVYAGSVGSGFDSKLLDDLLNKMDSLKVAKCPFFKRPEDKKDAIWLRPELVAEIKFMDWTEDLHLRNPVFLQLRSDIEPQNVRRVQTADAEENNTATLPGSAGGSPASRLPGSARTGKAHSEPESRVAETTDAYGYHSEFDRSSMQPQIDSLLNQLDGKQTKLMVRSAQHDISLTNLPKILFPAIGDYPPVTKRDFLRLIVYLSPLILEQIAHRPLTMIRSPSGVKGKQFFQKHWHLELPDFLHSVQIKEAEPAKKDYLVCNNLQSLLFLAQHNILEFHAFLSRCEIRSSSGSAITSRSMDELLDLPDYMVFDIDYHKENENNSDLLDREAFKKAREAAHVMQETLNALELSSYINTSGRNGLHIYIPIKSEFSFEEVRCLSETISKHIESDHSRIISTNPVAARNQHKVFLDYLANSRGRSIAVPYTTRITAQATVSAPIEWSELDSIYPDEINQHTIRDRLERKGDIWKEMLKYREDLSRRFVKREKQE